MTAYAVLTGGGSNKTLTFKCEEHTLGANEWDVSNTGGSLPEWFSERENITQVVFESSFADARPKTCHSWFWIFRNLTTITGIENLNTSQVTTMASMFAGCSSLTNLDVSHFNTSQVTDMSYLFYGCSRLTSLDVSSFNTSEVTYMECMFAVCSSLTSLDLSSFNTSQVTDMSYMFLDCSSLTSLSIGKDFTVGGGTDTDDMFSGCTALENGTLIVKGTSAPSIAKDIFGVFTNGTLVTAISQTDLGYTGPDADGKYTWKGGKFNKSMKLTNNLGANVTVTFYKSAAEPTEAFADAPGDEADIANGGDWIVMHIVPADGYWTDAQLLMASEAVAGYWTDAQLPMTQEAAVSLARAKAPGLDLGQIPTLLKRDTYTDTEGTHDRQDGAGWYYYQIPADHTPAAGYTTSTIEGYVVPKFDLMSDTPAPEISEDKKKYTFKALPDWSVEVTLDDVSFTCTGTPQCPKITNEKLEVKKGNNVIVTFTNVSDHITTSGTATDAGTDHAFTIGAVANSIFANSRNLTFSIGEVPASITVNTESLELEIDDTYTIVATTTPEGLPVTYVPDDSGIYCVDVNGNVTALRVGVGSILVKVGGDGVYAVDSKTITVHVTKTLDENNITLDIPTGGYVYDGTPKEPTVTVKYGNKTFTKGTDYNVTYSNNVNAGENTATVTVTDIPGGDYNVSGTKTFSIAKKDLTVTAKDQTIDYGTEIATGVAQVTANGLLGTDAVSSVTLTASTTEMTSTGTITASDAVIKNDETDVTANYEIKYEPSALIIEYAMTLAAGYATFCSPFDLQLPDGLKAYTVSAVGDKSVELTEQTAIGKDVAMILHAEAAGTYKLRKGEAQTFISVPDFVGVTSAAGTDVSTVAGEVYILKNGQFVWGRTGVVPQYRCYLVLGSTAGARSLSLVIAGDTNGIDHLLWSDEDDDSWYTLDGRKLEGKPTVKGLYIMIPANDRSKGKTVMIK
ncbi:MAG: BspA family leucine-rich repeat surface protein [Prevotella sp.]|nr:BspA family leucine-rich repeat surface protein [Prevotella sp.]